MNLLFLIVHKPAAHIDWGNVDGVLNSFVKAVESHQSIDIGHVQWGWSCYLHDQRVEGASGFTGDQLDEALSLALEGWGVTAAVLSYGDGYFEPPWLVQLRSQGADQENLKVLTLETDSASCSRFLASYQEIRFKQRIGNFRLLEEPKEVNSKLEDGANCVSVAQALFSQVDRFPANVFKDSQIEWNLPENLFGEPDAKLPAGASLLSDWNSRLRGRRGISVNLFQNRSQSGSAIRVMFLDPQRIYGNLQRFPSVVDLR